MGIVLFSLSLSLAAGAQVTPTPPGLAVPATRAPRVKSPEVLPDKRVVFRLWAPEANVVTMTGEWKVGPAAKESLAKGVRVSGV